MPLPDSQSLYAAHGPLVRLAYLALALLCWTATLGGCLLRRRTVVLCYHGVTPAQRSAFAAQMRRLVFRAYAQNESTAAGQQHAGRPRVQITFDDAFRNLLENALPLLQELRIPATVFVVTGNLGRPPAWDIPPDHPDANEPVMSSEELRQAVHAQLCRVGSHTVTHPRLTDLPLSQQRDELLTSKAALEQLVNMSVNEIAFPFGAFDWRTVAAAQGAGYRGLYTLEPRCESANRPEGLIGRFSMSPAAWTIEFELTCAGAYAWLRPWRALVRSVRTRLRPAAPQEPLPA